MAEGGLDGLRNAGAEDWPAISRLLAAAGLPLAGAEEHLPGFVVIEEEGAVVACAALERYETSALLRSVAVDPARRSGGLGERLVRHLLDTAASDGLETVALLTTTAASWFPRFGFRPESRERIPEELTRSVEFRGACPDTAVLMRLDLRR